MLDVGTQPSPVLSWWRSTPRSSAGQAATGGRSSSQVEPGGAQVRQRHPVGAQHARVAAGQRHVAEVGQPAERLVVGEQHLAAPHRAVGAVAGAVEGDPDHLLVPAQPVLGHHRGDVGVVVLHRAHRPPAACARAHAGGAVAGVARRRRAAPARTPVSASRWRSVARQRLDACQVVHVADVLADPGVAALARRRRCSSGRRRRPGSGRPSNGSASGSGAYPRERRTGSSTPPTSRLTESSHGTWIGRSCRSQRVGQRREPAHRASSSSVTIGSPDEVARGHHQGVRARQVLVEAEQQDVQRRVGQHQAQVRVARCDRAADTRRPRRGGAAARSAGRGRSAAARPSSTCATSRAGGVEVGDHHRERLVAAALASRAARRPPVVGARRRPGGSRRGP